MVHTNKIRRRWKIIAIVSFSLFILDIALFKGITQYFPDAWEKEKEVIGFKVKASDEQQEIKDVLKEVSLHSQYAILVDMEDQQTLFEKNVDARIYPASLTKVLTAIVALDLKTNLQEQASVTADDLAGLWEANASVAGLRVKDTLHYEQALYALILPSGADAANFIGNHMSGSVENFVAEMNKKATSLGMVNTHFMNPTGLHEDTHYTTLEDMKKMMVLGWKNPVFRNVMTSLQYTVTGLQSHPDDLVLKSTLASYGDDLQFNGGEIIGGKSGYTLEAQCCLISIAKMEDGHMYMIISAKAEGQPANDQFHLKDAKLLYEKIADTRTQFVKKGSK